MKKRIRISTFGILVILLLIAVSLLVDQKPSASNSEENKSQSKNEQLISNQADDKSSKGDTADDLYKVVIDPGHGGNDPGSIGASGSYEKDFTLSLATKVYQLLKQIPQIDVYMTRDEDVFLSAEARVRPKFANDLGADLYISIHANTFTDPSVSGTETYYYNQNSLSLANIIHKHVAEATGFRNRGVKKENYFVLKDTTMPATLLEIGYITNPKDEKMMLTDQFQESVATSIKNGVKEYLEID
ncbi:N-acetylmuramoyl-L-alanine amidase family protein [Virgibacillus ndiopensis]|uniref:N-acetylmuramoyl-L-alanine amidase family protein n=1 Tax=Virgibacillus ndiopensis TaxID=2004408 RepID=UPI000C0729E5|nr:N-acetylmuramoyl-L-alanine amidase [Virgibacillus ndiopensis]